MCRPTPPTTLPTLILVCASAGPRLAMATTAAATTAAGQDRTMFMRFLPEAHPCWRALGQEYTSVRRSVELGRHVVHVLQRLVEHRSDQELLRIGQRLVHRPLLSRDHRLDARFENLVEFLLGQFRTEGVVGLIPHDARILVV